MFSGDAEQYAIEALACSSVSQTVSKEEHDMEVLVRGVPASAGKARGKARVILSSGEGQKLEPGEILVARITDASMFVGIIENARAIVTDLGGLGSHPAIVARELGIPCVVATDRATEVIETGMEIGVDGKEGVVYEPD